MQSTQKGLSMKSLFTLCLLLVLSSSAAAQILQPPILYSHCTDPVQRTSTCDTTLIQSGGVVNPNETVWYVIKAKRAEDSTFTVIDQGTTQADAWGSWERDFFLFTGPNYRVSISELYGYDIQVTMWTVWIGDFDNLFAAVPPI